MLSNAEQRTSKSHVKISNKNKNQVRTALLIIANKEIKSIMKDHVMQINSFTSEEMCKQFETNYVIKFKQTESPRKSSTTRKTVVHEDIIKLKVNEISQEEYSSLINYPRKSIHDLKKICVAHKKLYKNNNNLVSQAAMEESIDSKLSQSRIISQRCIKHLESINKRKVLTHSEKSIINIQQSFNSIQKMCGYYASETNKSLSQARETNNISNYDEELFDILECKGINYNDKIRKCNRLLTDNPNNQVFRRLNSEKLPTAASLNYYSNGHSKSSHNSIHEKNLTQVTAPAPAPSNQIPVLSRDRRFSASNSHCFDHKAIQNKLKTSTLIEVINEQAEFKEDTKINFTNRSRSFKSEKTKMPHLNLDSDNCNENFKQSKFKEKYLLSLSKIKLLSGKHLQVISKRSNSSQSSRSLKSVFEKGYSEIFDYSFNFDCLQPVEKTPVKKHSTTKFLSNDRFKIFSSFPLKQEQGSEMKKQHIYSNTSYISDFSLSPSKDDDKIEFIPCGSEISSTQSNKLILQPVSYHSSGNLLRKFPTTERKVSKDSVDEFKGIRHKDKILSCKELMLESMNLSQNNTNFYANNSIISKHIDNKFLQSTDLDFLLSSSPIKALNVVSEQNEPSYSMLSSPVTHFLDPINEGNSKKFENSFFVLNSIDKKVEHSIQSVISENSLELNIND